MNGELRLVPISQWQTDWTPDPEPTPEITNLLGMLDELDLIQYPADPVVAARRRLVEQKADEERIRREARKLVDEEERDSSTLVADLAGQFLTPQQLIDQAKQTYLVEGIIPEKTTGMIYGPPASYKSFLAAGWAWHIATGRAWEANGTYPVRQGHTVYVAAEGSANMGVRLAAWQAWNSTTVDQGHLILPEPYGLLSPESGPRIAAALQRRGIQPVLIVFDTLAKCAVGADENSARDMGQVADTMGYLTRELGCTTVVVHHATKDGTNYRGSSALLGAVDWVIQVKPNDKGGVWVTSEKMKDGEPFKPIILEPHGIEDSIVLRHAGKGKSTLIEEGAMQLLDVIERLTAVEPASIAAITSEAKDLLEISRSATMERLKWLVDSGLVIRSGATHQVRYRANKWLKRPEDAS